MARNPKARGRDMIISLAVIAVPVLLVIIFFTSTPKEEVEPIDLGPFITRAEAESPFPVLVAGNPGAGWVPVRAAWAQKGQPWITTEPAVGNSWQVGYLSPDEIYYGVLQRDESARELVRSGTREGNEIGEETTLAGRDWSRYESKDGRTRSLVNEQDGVTTVVSADTDFPELEAFTSTLVER
ncbi:DUF4245 domain-containing protein [Tessaracoccus sp. MC1756]|uniref:DUF4245 domain-containing protein n=1 Tax=Tessaracoccus sp. MC1756 TaxID=2760311 RepID=UPI0016026F51|nr:DUF4245 domain-containing protein [Tessaracoccus sp. MC1756]MBB1509607.1 DUF4245 domain-containing protein [Tessaracoccus sp. MC1756]